MLSILPALVTPVSRVLPGLLLVALVVLSAGPGQSESAAAGVLSLPLVPDVAAAAPDSGWLEALPEGVPYWASPYDDTTKPPSEVEAAAVSVITPLRVAPLQDLVQGLAAAVHIVAPAAPAPPPPAVTRGIIGTDQILGSARALLGVPYMWGGNTTSGLDCSAYVSRGVWGVSRRTTDTLPAISHRVDKADLAAGDILNLTRGQDPRGFGHVRLFDHWADSQHSRMWVFEETPPRSIYHVITYDPRYTPMRLNGYIPDESLDAMVSAASAYMDDDDGEPPLLVQRSAAVAAPGAAKPKTTPVPTVRERSAAVVPTQPAAKPSPESKQSSATGTATPAPDHDLVRAAATRTPAPPTPSPSPRSSSSAGRSGSGRTEDTRIVSNPTPTPVPPTPTPRPRVQQPSPTPPPPTPPPPPKLPAGPLPLAPAGLGGTAQLCHRALIVWTYGGRDAAGFRIYRDGQFIGGISSSTLYYTDDSLRPDTAYRYAVATTNANGESALSATVQVTTKPVSTTCK